MRTRLLSLLLLTVPLLWGCTRESVAPGETQPEEGLHMPFSLAVGLPDTPETKTVPSVAQLSGEESFRGIEQLYIIPFKTEDAVVQATDRRWSLNLRLPQLGIPGHTFGPSAEGGEFDGLVSNNNARLYDNVYVCLHSNSVLVYGKAPDEEVAVADADSIHFKHHNGVLTGPDFEITDVAGDISFDLSSIIPSYNRTTYNNWKQWILSYLKTITDVSLKRNGVTKYRFNDPSTYNNHPELTAAYYEFINEGRLFSLSDKTLSKKLTRLFRAVYPYAADKRNSIDYREGTNYYYVYELAVEILKKIQNTKYVTPTGSGTNAVMTVFQQAPSSFGLPDGLVPALFREGSKSFGTLETYSGLAAAPENNICYPPSLWYYVNSPLVSTEDPDVVNAYTSVVDAENNDLRPVTWNAITSLYDHTSVTGSARAAAIQKPVQYGVALMTVQMQRVTSSNLKDARGNNVAVNNKKFPLTGIILADQHPVGFDFKPTAESSGAIRYIYDSEVNTSLNGTPLAYLSSNSGASSSVSMLALPTLENQPVHFALEFRNTSNNSFFAADGGEVFPTSCFYLLGVLRVSEGLNYGSDVLTSVFTSDHNTIVKVNVKSLANSYSVLPSLDDPQLLIGVEAEMTWDFAEPSIVPIQ